LVDRLKQALGQERKRNEGLLRQYRQLKERYDTLNRIRVRMEEKLDSRQEEINSK
jgi:hypothetical protein